MRLVLGGLATLVLAVASPAAAQTTEQRIAGGEALFEAANYDAALAEFEAVYGELDGDPYRYVLLWNIGQCHERLFRYDLALEYYRRYLDEGGPEAEDRATVEATMRALEGLLATVRVTVNVLEAEVWIDGRRIGTAPGEVRVPSGRHELEVRAEGYVPATTEIQLAARQSTDIALELQAVSTYRGVDSWLFWTSTGIALAAGAAFAILGGVAQVEHDRVEAMNPYRRLDSDLQHIERLSISADILLGSAALFATTAGVLAFLTDWGGEPGSDAPATAYVLPTVTPTALGVSAGGTW
jgi:tetratricopeptide (TPR) repeat protein